MAAALPPLSPTSSVSFSPLPQDTVVRPNDHPYAIRTTSTGILSRSNSSGRNIAASRHHYVPLSPAPAREGRRGHRYAKSLTDEPVFDLHMPRPLPIPPTFTGDSKDYKQSRWYRETSVSSQDGSIHGSPTVEDLPSNPKLWTPAQVSTYLYTALRVAAADNESGESLPVSAVDEIIIFTREANINGRIFLRLIAEDLDKRGVRPVWRDALLNASRNLRQNVIKGRIWGFESDSPSPSLPSHPFTNPAFNSSSSSLELSDEEGEAANRPSRRRGKVRGMVETFERSGSFSSESSLESDSVQAHEELGRWFKPTSTPENAIESSPLVTEPLPLVSPSPMRPAAEEPTVEALLAESEPVGSWGARAWEEFDIAPGVTVKRADASPAPPPAVPFEPPVYTFVSHSDGRLGERLKYSTRHKGKQDRRVVTAIFTPAAIDRADEIVQSPVMDIDGRNSTERVPSYPPSDVKDDTRSSTSASARELALQAELAETRALVGVFRSRLEEVERKVAGLEYAVQRGNSGSKEVDRAQQQQPAPPSSTDSIARQTFFATNGDSGTLLDHVPTVPDLDADDMTIAAPCPQSLGPSAQIDTSGVHSDESQKVSADSPDGTEGPSLVSELPQYVLLVGLGVCAVVFRVILKKAVGRGSGYGWRF